MRKKGRQHVLAAASRAEDRGGETKSNDRRKERMAKQTWRLMWSEVKGSMRTR